MRNWKVSKCFLFVLLFFASERSSDATSPFFNRLTPQRGTAAFVSNHANQRQRPSLTSPDMAPFGSGTATDVVTVGEIVGKGSYGTVHLMYDNNDNDSTTLIGKRCWQESELTDAEDPKERAERCEYYFNVERHTLDKLKGSQEVHIPKYMGIMKDEEGREWMIFEPIFSQYGSKLDSDSESRTTTTKPALSLDDVIKLDWSDQHTSDPNDHHHLYLLQEELGMDHDSTFGDTLDVSFLSLLKGLSFIHSKGIVHRDIKPGNLLCDASTQSLVLIDFGSAADMDPVSNGIFGKKRVGLEDEGRAAISPIYSAPEVYIKPNRAPHAFDVYSAGLIFCQLLFNYLDERTDAGFVAQLKDFGYDLDAWLAFELESKVRPDGLEDALMYLAERPGLWRLLGKMLRADPERRVSSKDAKDQLEKILSGIDDADSVVTADTDGAFFESVVQAVDTCFVEEIIEEQEEMMSVPRPLHFVATFSRRESLGLLLSEADEGLDEDADEEAKLLWEEATADAYPGEVFVKGVVEGGQAEALDIFEVGDRVQGVGEFPLMGGGFAQVLAMLETQPASAKNVKLHFDRRPADRPALLLNKVAPHVVRVSDQGTWSVKGRRKYQEDRFVLHEIQNENENILVAGVFDGHGGLWASQTASQLVPSLLSEIHTTAGTSTLQESLRSAWETTCNTYRNGCDDLGGCIADYDPQQGILVASTGSDDLTAGTTAAVVAMSKNPQDGGSEMLEVLNCGDSRTILVGRPFQEPQNGGGSTGKTKRTSVVHFASRDHSPACEFEKKRLAQGVEDGFSYSIPTCSMSQWRMKVGDYRYAVSRSLEGSFATSKGIVSDPDMTRIDISEMLQQRENGIIVIASDGLFEVMDNEEAGRDVLEMREQGMSAADAAKGLCKLALNKGTNDNVSALVIYLV